jgi:ABC-type branched-subunit amino acid transport system ATPase component
MTIVLIEHDMGLVMDISDRVVALDFGRKIAEGAPEAIKQNPQVIKAYLGQVG